MTFTPTGQLALRIKEWSDGKRRNWSDGDKRRLEDCLNNFLTGLIQVAAVKKARDLEKKPSASVHSKRRPWHGSETNGPGATLGP